MSRYQEEPPRTKSAAILEVHHDVPRRSSKEKGPWGGIFCFSLKCCRMLQHVAEMSQNVAKCRTLRHYATILSNHSHKKHTLKYILAVWPRDNSRPPSLTLSLARTSERHSRILYPSCTHCRVQTRAKNLFAHTLPYSLGPPKQHTPPATTAGQATTTRSAVHGIGCKA